jgi:mannan endo-1,4-beta-mannosidase
MAIKSEGTRTTMRSNENMRSKISKRDAALPWIQVANGAPYFITDQGEDWTPVGQNDAITWPELHGLFRRKDLFTVEAYLQMLAAHGVTCLRLMLEYCHGENRYFEKPVGRFQPNMVRLWDDLFMLCEKWGLRILLTPYDTFWMWLRWSHHPYKKANGGPCDKRNQWLLCKDTRAAIKQRLVFATERWGGSGALFAWDIWNEIHPAHGGDSVGGFNEFVEEISSFLRETELRLHGRAHPQTVSVFGPVLQRAPEAAECIFRHPALHFASVHFYESGTIDHPKNTIDAAISTGRLTREALAHVQDTRPFFDSEHGPIHTFKDKKKTLPEPFDDEYFRHMQWAHVASGGAGGGMRWPNRHPHSLTAGMRKAQQALSRFLPLLDWHRFRRINLNNEIQVSNRAFAVFGCGDDAQAVLWLLRTDTVTKTGTLNKKADALSACAHLPGLQPGSYRVTAWDTTAGTVTKAFELTHNGKGPLCVPVPPVQTDLALAITQIRNKEVNAIQQISMGF